MLFNNRKEKKSKAAYMGNYNMLRNSISVNLEYQKVANSNFVSFDVLLLCKIKFSFFPANVNTKMCKELLCADLLPTVVVPVREIGFSMF